MALIDDFKGALSSWASGVSVVTTRDGNLVYGITVSSFSSLSVDPLLVIVCLANSNRIGQMVQDSGAFAVNILASDQEELARYFASAGRVPVEAFDEIPVTALNTGSPLLEGAIAHLDCRLHSAIPGGDHTIAVGEVVAASYHEELAPLLYFRRRYHTLVNV